MLSHDRGSKLAAAGVQEDMEMTHGTMKTMALAMCLMPVIAAAQTAEQIAAAKAAHQPVTQVLVKKHLYPEIEQAPIDLKAALVLAHKTHKRIILDFGGDWCGDCQVLDIYFNQAPNAELLAKNFIKVNVNIGHEDANLDIAHKYGVPLQGVPALAVLDENGKMIYAQNKEFSDMRYMQSSSVTEFLTKWKR
jgi:thiol:disulfide interchange protein